MYVVICMFRSLLSITMKRAQKSRKDSGSIQTFKNESIENNAKPKTARRQTRRNKQKDEDTSSSSEKATLTPKLDLSEFEIQSKQKIKTESTNSKKLVKRQHVDVEYDKDVAKDNKIKKGKEGETVNANTATSSSRMPPHWKEVLQNLREMRKEHDAPVDTMGCDQCPDEKASPEVNLFLIYY